jgi:pyridoxal phosphate enzyme (YggS family)
MNILSNYLSIKNNISILSNNTKLVVVTKNYNINQINTLINAGHLDFGENRVQEASDKWSNSILLNNNIQLHLIGSLQSNKAKQAFNLFSYIHSLDSQKLAKIFSDLEISSKKNIKYFIQLNVGNEPQKSGITIDKADQFIKYCKIDLKLNIIGLMCIPPADCDPTQYFISLAKLARAHNLKELSMGMSNDYECAINNGATFVRIGSKIFSSN